MQKILVINIEIKARELESRLMVALEALKRDYVVIIGAQSEIYKILKYLPESIVFEKSISKNKIEKLTKIKTLGHKIINLDEEGSASQNNKWIYLKQRLSKETLDLTEYFFTWGENEKKVIESNYPNDSSKIKITGNPRIDTWKSEYVKMYEKEVNNITQEYKSYVFIASNFGVNHAKGNDFLKKQAKDYKIIETKDDEEIFDENYAFLGKVYTAFLEMIKNLAILLPSKTIVIRPHPSENIEAWKEIFKEYNNVFIEYKYSVTPWIIASKCMIHSSCTTGIEGFLMKKPVFSYLPYSDNDFVNYVSNTLSDICSTQEQLIDKLNAVFDGKYDLYYGRESKMQEAKPILHNIDSFDAAKTIVDYIDKIEIPSHKTIGKNRVRLFKYESAVKKAVKKIIRYRSDRDEYAHQKMPGIVLSEMHNKIREIQMCNDVSEPILVKVSQLGPSLFMLNVNEE
ncbi:MAG: surface carbohydrate biosynthesis protein [Campylobacterota bacterium]